MELPRGNLATPSLLITITPPTLGRSYYIARSLCYRSVKFQPRHRTIGPFFHQRSCPTKSVTSFYLRTLLFHVLREGTICGRSRRE